MIWDSKFNYNNVVHISYGHTFYESKTNIPTIFQKYTDRYNRIPCSRVKIFFKGEKPTQIPKFLEKDNPLIPIIQIVGIE